MFFVSDFKACDRTSYDVRLMVPGKDVTTVIVGEAKAQDTIIQYSMFDEDIVLRGHYVYGFDTGPGYCGALLFKCDRTDACKIIGMNVAGAVEASVGLASALCSESIVGALSSFGWEPQMCFPIDEYGADMSVPGGSVESLGYIGKTLVGVTDQPVTKIKRSPFHGWDGDPIKEPVQLSGRWNGVDVKETAREKLKCPEFKAKDEQALETARITVGHLIETSSKIKPRTWTLDEAAFGNPDQKYCDAMDFNTSAGMPWKKMSPKPGKKGFLQKQHSPRMFSGGPLDFNLVVRMLFGQWCACVMDGRIENEIGVGINPHSDEWTILARRITSEFMAAGDFQ